MISLKHLKERKFSLSIYLLLYVFLIMTLIFRYRIEDLYLISAFLMSLIFILSQYFGFGYRYFIGFAIIVLITCPFLIIFKFNKLAEYFTNYVYGFLIFGIVGYFLDSLRVKLKGKKRLKAYRIIFLIFLILILILPPIFYRNYIETTFNTVKQEYNRIFNKDAYYSYKEELKINGEILKGNIEIAIDYPKDGDNISGPFMLEGWAIEHNSSVKDSVIDMIEVFLDGKPGEGKCIGYTKPNVERIELGEIYGEQFNHCGFRLFIDSREFENGKHTIYIYAHNKYFGWDFICIDINVEN